MAEINFDEFNFFQFLGTNLSQIGLTICEFHFFLLIVQNYRSNSERKSFKFRLQIFQLKFGIWEKFLVFFFWFEIRSDKLGKKFFLLLNDFNFSYLSEHSVMFCNDTVLKKWTRANYYFRV